MAAPRAQPKGTVVATFDYTDADGTLRYQVLKYDPKNFRQRRPDGNGGWIWSLGDVRRVPYRWPELLQYLDATVFVCEGEKDVDRIVSLGHCATCVADGKWTDNCVQALAGRDIVILQDNATPAARKRSKPRRHCTPRRRRSASSRCRTCRTKATCPIGSTPIRAAPRSWWTLALMWPSGCQTMLTLNTHILRMRRPTMLNHRRASLGWIYRIGTMKPGQSGNGQFGIVCR
jgi:hypothetical protein